MRDALVILYESKRDFELYEHLKSKGFEFEFHSFHEGGTHPGLLQAEIVILDCDYDVNRALELLREAKSASPSTPVFFLTRLSSEEIVIKAYRGGAREYFKKPIRMNEFQEAIENLLAIKQGSRERRAPLRISLSGISRESLENLNTDKPFSIVRALQYVQQHLAEDLCLSKIAHEANLSKFHFCRFFKKHMGMSPRKYVTFVRVERSKELLKQKDFSISMVATLVGFNDLGNFERHFKRVTGITPSSYLESVGKRESSKP